MSKKNRLSKEQKKVLFISILGTALEFYDFTLYSVFSVSIGKTFFPANREIISILSAFAAFAAGFIMRPFGGILIGYLGDKFGRRYALTISMLLMGIPALITGILPSFETVGIIAPIIIVFARLTQGLSAGGEFNGAAIFILEHFHNSRKRGFFSALISSAGGLGALFALILGSLASHKSFPEWGWRIPFILGALISFVGFLLRRTIDESPEFKASRVDKKSAPKRLKDIIKNHFIEIAVVIAIGALDGSLAYLLVGFMNVYFNHFSGIDISSSMLISSLGLITYLIATPFTGVLYDRLSNKRFFNFTFCILIFSSIPLFYLFQSKYIYFKIIGIACLASMFSLISGSQHAFMQGLFPTSFRFRAIAFGFNLGSCVVGGTTPIILTWLMDSSQNLSLPGYFLFVESLVCFFIFNLYFRQNKKNINKNK